MTAYLAVSEDILKCGSCAHWVQQLGQISSKLHLGVRLGAFLMTSQVGSSSTFPLQLCMEYIDMMIQVLFKIAAVFAELTGVADTDFGRCVIGVYISICNR